MIYQVLSVICITPAMLSIIYILMTIFFGQAKQKLKSIVKISAITMVFVVSVISFSYASKCLTNYEEITKDAQFMINNSDIWLDEKTNEFFILEKNVRTVKIEYSRVYIDKKLYKELGAYAN